MLRIFLIACAIAFLGGLYTGKSVLAQDSDLIWSAKPVQCSTKDKIYNKFKEEDLQVTFAGYGLTHSVNYDKALPVILLMGYNAKTTAWVMLEIGIATDEACVVGYGPGSEIGKQGIDTVIDALNLNPASY